MNSVKTYLGLSALALGFLTGCLSEDSLEFPPEDDQGEALAVKSVAITSFLEGIAIEEEFCYTIFFPITLEFNNGIEIEINDLQGLVDVALSQNTGLHVDGIAYPILAQKDNQLLTVNSDVELNELLFKCGIPTLNELLYDYYACFDPLFPLSVLDIDSMEIEISTEEQLIRYFSDLDTEFEAKFVFPVSATLSDSVYVLNSYFDIYRMFDNCETCPEVIFEYESNRQNQFTFYGHVGERPGLWEAFWVIDGDPIHDQAGVVDELIFTETFPPGEYEICLLVKTELCPEGSMYCEVVLVEPICPEPSFELFASADSTVFEAIAEFEGRNETFYSWKVYDGEELIYAEEEGPNGDHVVWLQLEPGEYELCVFAETDLCPEGVWYCEDLIVPEIESPCPDLFFDYEIPQDTASYTFFAEFEEMNQIPYLWLIWSGETLIYEELEEPGGDNQIFYQFEPGIYEICLQTEVEGCPSTTYCEELVVD